MFSIAHERVTQVLSIGHGLFSCRFWNPNSFPMLSGWERGVALCLCGLLLLVACTTAPPQNINNACTIFAEYDDWYDSARAVSARWGVPIPVLLAIIHQESAFEADATPRTRIFWIFPGPPRSSAFGYSQALNGTWDWYRQATGNSDADRTHFGDAIDFVGWYVNETAHRNRIAKHDAYRQYLAYHEGHGGYAQGSYRKKPWLIEVAQQVRRQADRYRRQLSDCGY